MKLLLPIFIFFSFAATSQTDLYFDLNTRISDLPGSNFITWKWPTTNHLVFKERDVSGNVIWEDSLNFSPVNQGWNRFGSINFGQSNKHLFYAKSLEPDSTYERIQFFTIDVTNQTIASSGIDTVEIGRMELRSKNDTSVVFFSRKFNYPSDTVLTSGFEITSNFQMASIFSGNDIITKKDDDNFLEIRNDTVFTFSSHENNNIFKAFDFNGNVLDSINFVSTTGVPVDATKHFELGPDGKFFLITEGNQQVLSSDYFFPWNLQWLDGQMNSIDSNIVPSPIIGPPFNILMKCTDAMIDEQNELIYVFENEYIDHYFDPLHNQGEMIVVYDFEFTRLCSYILFKDDVNRNPLLKLNDKIFAYYRSGDSLRLQKMNCNPLSVHENEEELFELYPNPADNFLTISVPNSKEYELQIFSADGKVILSSSFSSKLTIDLSTQSNGVYYVKVSSGEYQQVEKLVVQ